MAPEDLKRYLEKWADTATWAYAYFCKQSESHAAQHCNTVTFYSPIAQRLNEMLGDLSIVRKSIDQPSEA